MKNFFDVGDRIYGYCSGAFGRDSYEDKICIFVNSSIALFQGLETDYGFVIDKSDERYENDFEQWKTNGDDYE